MESQSIANYSHVCTILNAVCFSLQKPASRHQNKIKSRSIYQTLTLRKIRLLESLGSIFSFVLYGFTAPKRTDFLQEHHDGIFRALLLPLKELLLVNSMPFHSVLLWGKKTQQRWTSGCVLSFQYLIWQSKWKFHLTTQWVRTRSEPGNRQTYPRDPSQKNIKTLLPFPRSKSVCFPFYYFSVISADQAWQGECTWTRS